MRRERGLMLVAMVALVVAGHEAPGGVSAGGAEAQPQGQGRDLSSVDWLRTFTFRNVSPFRMGARASAIAVPASPQKDHLYTFYVSTWTGGVFKTTNGGTTFKPVFDTQNKLTIGAVSVAPSNANVVWVGTGDHYNSRSSYPGDGIYKSVDAGGTWTNVGLRDSHHISRIAIHPTNPDIVYVSVMGHLYTPNPERGVFKTSDGGRSWERVLFVNDQVGAIDLVMNPRSPNVLYAATYDKRRTPEAHINAGPESGIHKTTDGGKSWTRLKGGLPDGQIGRIGLDIYLENPDVVYAVVNNVNPLGKGLARGCTGGQRAGFVGGEVYRTENAGQVWSKVSSADDDLSPKGSGHIGSGDEDCDGFTQIRVDPNDDQKLYVLSVSLANSTDGGKTWYDIGQRPRRLFPGIFGDLRTMWIDPQNSDRMMIGSDASFFASYDGGETSDQFFNLPVGEVYGVSVDMEDPYNIYASLQDHEEWKASSIGPRGNVSMLDWAALGSGDGMFTLVDPTDARWAFTTSEWGGIFRVDQQLGYRTSVRATKPGGAPYRFMWGTPLHMSPHNSATIYTGGEVLLESVDRGSHWTEISPDLTTLAGAKEPALPDGTAVPTHYWFSLSAIAESPITPGVIWVGTNDGKVHVTRNGGGRWTDLTKAVASAGGPIGAYVSRVRASQHAVGRAYLAKSDNKRDDFRPYLYTTDDFGATWTSISGNLPEEPIHVVWEDHRNPDLLFVGSGGGLFVTIDRGKTWAKMNNNMPNVPVLDLVVHPRENDLVVGSWGRGVFITNIDALQEMTPDVLTKDVHLFAIKPTAQRVMWSFGSNDSLFAQRHLVTPNEPNGMPIRYYLKNARNEALSVVITNAQGTEVAKLTGGATAGVNTVVWNMLQGVGMKPGGGGGGARGPGYSTDLWVPLGDYRVTLQVGEQKVTQNARIAKTQGWSLGPFPVTIRHP